MAEINPIATDYVNYLKGHYPRAEVDSFRDGKRYRWVISTIVRFQREWQEFLMAWYYDDYKPTSKDTEEYEREIDTWLANHKVKQEVG